MMPDNPTCETCDFWEPVGDNKKHGKCSGVEVAGIMGAIQLNQYRPGIATGPGWQYLGDVGVTPKHFGCNCHSDINPHKFPWPEPKDAR